MIALALAIYNGESLWAAALVKFGANSVDLVENQASEVVNPAKTVKPVTENDTNRADTGESGMEAVFEETVTMVETEMIDAEPIDTEANSAAAISEPELGNPEQNVEVLLDTSEEAGEKVEFQSEPAEIEVAESERIYNTKQTSNDTIPKYDEWLKAKLQQSREWLSSAPRNNISIQVMMSRKSSESKLVDYLQNEWP
ncbi:MAG: hypothetical protein ACYST9_06820, partial [Planctomycetota bacterium]